MTRGSFVEMGERLFPPVRAKEPTSVYLATSVLQKGHTGHHAEHRDRRRPFTGEVFLSPSVLDGVSVAISLVSVISLKQPQIAFSQPVTRSVLPSRLRRTGRAAACRAGPCDGHSLAQPSRQRGALE